MSSEYLTTIKPLFVVWGKSCSHWVNRAAPAPQGTTIAGFGFSHNYVRLSHIKARLQIQICSPCSYPQPPAVPHMELFLESFFRVMNGLPFCGYWICSSFMGHFCIWTLLEGRSCWLSSIQMIFLLEMHLYRDLLCPVCFHPIAFSKAILASRVCH